MRMEKKLCHETILIIKKKKKYKTHTKFFSIHDYCKNGKLQVFCIKLGKEKKTDDKFANYCINFFKFPR